ncbi:MAG TPA: PIG-L family deacetylase [Steroidobacteraceae bacterium]|nr:PIG-L family deacetylase [Steroidobacteraceae bacterium]
MYRFTAAALGLLLASCGGQAPEAPAPPTQPAAASAILPPLGANTSLLVVSPHPDDETLCCAGLIERVLQDGGQVSVLWITSGDGERIGLMLTARSLLPGAAAARHFGHTRIREARAAATLLGVPPAGQLFLGYPDGGLLALLREHRTTPFRSPVTDADAVPYSEALFPGHPYTGESLEKDFTAVLARMRPTLILAPSPLDEHPDHRAAGLLAIALSAAGDPAATGPLGTGGTGGAAQNEQRAVRYWIVHGGEGWPSPRGLLPGIPLTPPPAGRGLTYGTLDLAPAEEDRKLAALRAHETQLRAMEPFLLSFVRTTELYFAAPTH